MKNEDVDIKIYSNKSQRDSGDDLENLAAAIEYHTNNGNKEKVKTLGKKIAQTLTENEISLDFSDVDDIESIMPEITHQMRVLFVYTAGKMIRNELKSPILKDISRRATYDELRISSPQFYYKILDGGAYTFYRLCLYKGGDDVDEQIGQTFAMLCSHENDRRFINVGKAVYKGTIEYVKKLIKELNLQD